MRYKIFFLFLFCLSLSNSHVYAGPKKVMNGVLFDGKLDYDKLPRGKGVLHVYKGFGSDNKTKDEIMTISGDFYDNDIKDAEIVSGNCKIRGMVRYKFSNSNAISSDDSMFQGYFAPSHDSQTLNMVIALDSVTIESDLYTTNVPIRVKNEIIIGGRKNYRTNICDIFLEEKYSSSAFEEISSFFDSSIDSYKWQVSLFGTEGGLCIIKFPWQTAKLCNNSLLDLEFEGRENGIWLPDDHSNNNTPRITKGRYYSPDGDDVEFQPHSSFGIKITKAHIVSDHNVIYDGKWDGHVGKDGFRVKIKYPDGSFFEGDVKTDFLKRYNLFVGIDVYKILNKSNSDYLKLHQGTLINTNGEKKVINNE